VNAERPEGPVFLHPAHHPWLKPLGGQRSVDDVGDFPPGTLQEADIIINANTLCWIDTSRTSSQKSIKLEGHGGKRIAIPMA